MSTSTRIGIIGAGNVGGNLGARLASSGLPVRYGVRPGADTTALLARSPGAEATDVVEAAAWAELIVLAVPAAAAVAAAQAAGDLAGKVLVDATNPVAWADGPVLAAPPEGSVAAALAKALPAARVVKGFNTFGAEIHANPDFSGVAADVLFAGDDAAAKELASAVATRGGFHPIDAGPLRNAALLESVAVLWIHLALNGGQGRASAFKLLRRT